MNWSRSAPYRPSLVPWGIKMLLPSVPSFSCLFIIESRHHHDQCYHARFSQYDHELHLTRMDPRICGGCHELNFRTASEKPACEALKCNSTWPIWSSSSFLRFRSFGWKQQDHSSWFTKYGSLRGIAFWILSLYVLSLVIRLCIAYYYTIYFDFGFVHA